MKSATYIAYGITVRSINIRRPKADHLAWYQFSRPSVRQTLQNTRVCVHIHIRDTVLLKAVPDTAQYCAGLRYRTPRQYRAWRNTHADSSPPEHYASEHQSGVEKPGSAIPYVSSGQRISKSEDDKGFRYPDGRSP
eukprot:1563977-Rhodomonas_salina.3